MPWYCSSVNGMKLSLQERGNTLKVSHQANVQHTITQAFETQGIRSSEFAAKAMAAHSVSGTDRKRQRGSVPPFRANTHISISHMA